MEVGTVPCVVFAFYADPVFGVVFFAGDEVVAIPLGACPVPVVSVPLSGETGADMSFAV